MFQYLIHKQVFFMEHIKFQRRLKLWGEDLDTRQNQMDENL
jgi:hypothetical protein